ncbi:F-box/WD repeat-containing protein lin-23 [Morella rubra]|uniref:F-box/WD repeat-containing protein lin-23 n=1 Tax=Morella rubra TaxID=262757 RepID=A0A6A1UVF0_9ROSI|nr:F-box/WD repeat-containing protein lin-23 [Morella rubra]
MSGRYNHGGFLQGHHFAILCLVAIGDIVFSGFEDSTIRVWRRENGNLLHSCLSVIEGHQGLVRCLAASIESNNLVVCLLIYSACLDQTFKVCLVKIYPTKKANFEEPMKDPQKEVVEFEMSPVL